MDWVLQHLQFIIAAAGGVAWWLNQRKQLRARAEAKSPAETAAEDPDLAERTRRIREEIQRKIEQRTQGSGQAANTVRKRETVSAPSVIRDVARRQQEPPRLTDKKLATAHLEAQKTAEILEQQIALAERLRQATEFKAAALRRQQFENKVSSGAQSAVTARGALGDDLSSPDTLRRAFILREIIGPPVALRS